MMARVALLSGAVLAICYTLMISAADGITKVIAQGYAAPQLYALSGLIVVALCMLWPDREYKGAAPRSMLQRVPRTGQPIATFARSVLAIAATLGFFVAFRALPLSEIMVIIATMPLIGAAIARPLLGERPTLHVWLALGLGMCGVMMLFPAGLPQVSLAHLVAIGACVLGAFSLVLSRWINLREEGTLAQVFYPNLAIGVTMLAVLPLVWRPMAPGDVALVVIYAVFLFGARWTMVIALKRAPAYIVLPILNLQFVWMALIGLAVFGEVPTWSVIAGSAMTIAAGLYLVWNDATHRGRDPALAVSDRKARAAATA